MLCRYYKKRLLKKIKSVKEDYFKTKEYLGEFVVKEMKPLEVTGEIAEYAAYEEYETIRNSTGSLKKAVTLASARRVINFDEDGMKGERFIVVRELEDTDKNPKGNLFTSKMYLYCDRRW